MTRYTVSVRHTGTLGLVPVVVPNANGDLVRYTDAQDELDRLNAYHMDERRSAAAMSDQLQAELDRVMGEAVKFAEAIVMHGFLGVPKHIIYEPAKRFLSSPEVLAWRERRKG